MTKSCIISVSISKDQREFLDSTNNSPSELLQRSINQEMATYKNASALIKKLEGNIALYQKELTLMTSFLEERGIDDVWRDWRGKNQDGTN